MNTAKTEKDLLTYLTRKFNKEKESYLMHVHALGAFISLTSVCAFCVLTMSALSPGPSLAADVQAPVFSLSILYS